MYRMKKSFLIAVLFIISNLIVSGQVNGLFVNDNKVSEQNTETIYQILEQYLGTLAYFDAIDSARSPKLSDMADYNLVIWYCGADEDDLYFWNGNHQDNPYLAEYLDNGGSLWVMGSGFLNSRYIKPPRNFEGGTFLFDYLGVNKWSVESYTSDNGQGAPELVISSGNPVHTLTLDIIKWENPPERFIDGCDLVEGCSAAYIFGPNTYDLYGEKPAFYYPHKKFDNITFAFDPAAMDSKGDMSYLLSDVLIFYNQILSGIEEDLILEKSMRIYPNPASNIINIDIGLPGQFQYKLIDILGNVVREDNFTDFNAAQSNTEITVDDLPGGIYLLRVEGASAVVSKSVVLTR